MNQILLGSITPFLIGTVIYLLKRCRASFTFLLLVPLFTAASAVWAILPDIPRVLGMNDLYLKLARDPRCDLFYWHYTIDLNESDSELYILGVALIFLLFLAAACRELYMREKES